MYCKFRFYDTTIDYYSSFPPLYVLKHFTFIEILRSDYLRENMGTPNMFKNTIANVRLKHIKYRAVPFTLHLKSIKSQCLLLNPQDLGWTEMSLYKDW